MKLIELNVRGYRSHVETSFQPHGAITTVVGENGSGKSSLLLALDRAIQFVIERTVWPSNDFSAPSIVVEAEFRLSAEEKEQVRLFFQELKQDGALRKPFEAWIRQAATRVSLEVHAEGDRVDSIIKMGRLIFGPGEHASLYERDNWGGPTANLDRLQSILGSDSYDFEGASDEDRRMLFQLGAVRNNLLALIRDSVKLISEYRVASSSGRTQHTESLSGAETASALLNLKNHSKRAHRKRYQEICEVFASLFPRFEIEAVESQPGGGQPIVQFYQDGRTKPIPVANISAGIHQVLTLLVNVIGRDEKILLVEHPEEHLHPQSCRYVLAKLREAASTNQVILTTHDPNLCSPANWDGFQRLVWHDGRTRIFRVGRLDDRERSQIEGVLEHPWARELLFARCAALVEDESQFRFLRAVAARRGALLDEASVSLLPVDGHTGFGRYITLLEMLGIPFVALRDQKWGDPSRHPPSRYYSLDAELEDFLAENGARSLLERAKKEVGRGKARIADWVGRNIDQEQVPGVFSEFLETAVELADVGATPAD